MNAAIVMPWGGSGCAALRFADESGRIACAVGYAGIYLQEAIHRRPSYLKRIARRASHRFSETL